MASMRSITLAAGLALSATAPALAQTDAVLTFGYTDLNGSYVGDSAGGTFTARASAIAPLQSGGDVTRLISVAGSTVFSPGFVGGIDPADAFFEISVFGKSGSIAFGVGYFLLTDVDGDTIRGDIDGFWNRRSSGRTFFNGSLSNVVLTNISGDGTFDGDGGGSIDMDFIRQQPLTGALVQLFIRTGVGFFDSAFQDNSTQVSGELIPTPGAAALALMGLAAAGRRRR